MVAWSTLSFPSHLPGRKLENENFLRETFTGKVFPSFGTLWLNFQIRNVFFQVILMKNIIGDSLLLVMILGELQKKLNRQMPDLTYAIFFKSWGFKDVKYDIPMCQSHSSRPSPFNSSPQCKKSSLRYHFSRNS